MDKITKLYILIGPVIISFIFAMTSPTIQIYFIKMVSPELLAISNMLAVGIAAVINSTIPNDKLKTIYSNNFKLIVIIDVVFFTIISYGGLLDVSIRFIGFAILNAVSTTLWFTVMSNAINNKIAGSELTNWNAFLKSLELYGSLAGCIIAICFNFDVTTCLILQCIANGFMGCTDLIAFKRLKKIKDLIINKR